MSKNYIYDYLYKDKPEKKQKQETNQWVLTPKQLNLVLGKELGLCIGSHDGEIKDNTNTGNGLRIVLPPSLKDIYRFTLHVIFSPDKIQLDLSDLFPI